jgi:hypothetical protein
MELLSLNFRDQSSFRASCYHYGITGSDRQTLGSLSGTEMLIARLFSGFRSHLKACHSIAFAIEK